MAVSLLLSLTIASCVFLVGAKGAARPLRMEAYIGFVEVPFQP